MIVRPLPPAELDRLRDPEAGWLFTSLQQAFLNLRRGRPGQLPPPVEDFGRNLNPLEQAMLRDTLAYAVVGSLETVRQGLDAFVVGTGADELMVTAQIFDHEARLRSFEITTEARDARLAPLSGATVSR